jgi:serine/threonine-protein kinase
MQHTRDAALTESERSRPSQLGRWQLVTREAEGAMTEVYRARPAESVRQAAPYAVKVLKPVWQGEAAAEATLRREFEASAAVRHPSLVAVLSIESEADVCWTVMPWLDGVTLSQLLKIEALPKSAAFWYARQVAEALEAMHASGWMHGDVKPANVIISGEGHATLIDLGFARQPADPQSSHRCGWGTPQYIAPESITSALRPDIRSDLYSLGVMLYEMLSGRKPFEAADVAAVVRQHRHGRARPLQQLVPSLPKDVYELVDNMLAKEPLRRPQSPDEVVATLMRAEVEMFAERWRPRLLGAETTAQCALGASL